VKIPENQENKGGYDYFSNPTITQTVIAKLSYEPKDIALAKERQIKQLS